MGNYKGRKPCICPHGLQLNQCKPCKEAQKKEWYQRNKAAEQKKRKADYKAKKPSYIQRAKSWYQKNVAHRKGYMTEYANKNRNKINALSKKNAANHVEYYRDYHRGRQRAVREGDLTMQEWHDILEQYNYKCAYCLKGHNHLQAEHMVAFSKGGATSKDNIVPSCPSCNKKKHTKSILQFTGVY